MPIVSVILPVYNGERFLKEAIDSILAQTLADLELIVIDDGSTDKTAFILEELAAKDTRMHVIRQPSNRGIVEALNTGCRIASGQYLARMDADDVSLPTRLEKQVAYFHSHPEVGLVGTSAQLIDAEGRRQVVVTYPSTHDRIHWSMLFYNPIMHPTVMIRRDLFLHTGGYRKGYPEDYDLWRRLAGQTHLTNLPEVLLLLRKHTSNLSMAHEAYSLSSGMRVIRELILELLGKDVSEELLEIFYNPNSVQIKQRWQAAQLLQELSREFIKRCSSLQEEKRFIREDVADHLTSWALRKISIGSVLLIGKAITYSPSVTFRVFRPHLQVMINRIVA